MDRGVDIFDQYMTRQAFRRFTVEFGIKDGIEKDRLLRKWHDVAECGPWRLQASDIDELFGSLSLVSFAIHNRERAIKELFGEDAGGILREIRKGVEDARENP